MGGFIAAGWGFQPGAAEPVETKDGWETGEVSVIMSKWNQEKEEDESGAPGFVRRFT
jgi:hypothetical protein